MAVALPYRTASTSSVGLRDWMRTGENGKTTPIGGEISGWDYDTVLNLSNEVEIDVTRFLEETGLSGQNPRLRLNVISITGPSRYRKKVFSKKIPEQNSWTCGIDLVLDSRELAELLTLRTEIVLDGELQHKLPFVATASGSRLYEDIHKIQLEGSLGRFPMELVDFGNSLPGLRASNAMWHLEWDPTRPGARLLGAVLLYINASHKDFSERTKNMDPVMMSVLRCDVIRAMCEGMLHNEDFLDGYDLFDADTVGGQVKDWLSEAFGNASAEVLKVMMQSSPGRFEARIQEAFS